MTSLKFRTILVFCLAAVGSLPAWAGNVDLRYDAHMQHIFASTDSIQVNVSTPHGPSVQLAQAAPANAKPAPAANKMAGDTNVRETKNAKAAHMKLFIEENFPSANTCATCHPQQYKEWSVSQHAYAQLSPVYMAMQRTINSLTSSTNGDFCIRCHNQVGMNIGGSLNKFKIFWASVIEMENCSLFDKSLSETSSSGTNKASVSRPAIRLTTRLRTGEL